MIRLQASAKTKEQWRSAMDAIEDERVFRQETDPLTSFPTAQLHEAVAAVLARLEQELAATTAVCALADELHATAQRCRPWLDQPAPDVAALEKAKDDQEECSEQFIMCEAAKQAKHNARKAS